jgi:hypothetical protein
MYKPSEVCVSIGVGDDTYTAHVRIENKYVQIHCNGEFFGSAVWSRNSMVGCSGRTEHYIVLELEKALVEYMYVSSYSGVG